jgi:ribosomal protein S27AE
MKRTINKPIRIDDFTEKCPKCGEKVMYVVGTGTIFHGASESYEDWRVIKHDYCPRCGSTEIGTALIGQYLKLIGKDKYDK